eukprot:gene1777-biopygen3916
MMYASRPGEPLVAALHVDVRVLAALLELRLLLPHLEQLADQEDEEDDEEDPEDDDEQEGHARLADQQPGAALDVGPHPVLPPGRAADAGPSVGALGVGEGVVHRR